MKNLNKLLEKEKESYITTECFFRQIVIHIKGLEPCPNEREIEEHLSCCRDYYEKFGTKDGEYTPWVTGSRSK